MNTKGVEDGMNDDRCSCGHREPQHWPESQDQYKLRRCSIIGCVCEMYNGQPAVPVEERTAMPTREAVEKALGAQDYPALAIKYVLDQLTEGERRILFRAVIDAATPIPEERTAEMEQPPQGIELAWEYRGEGLYIYWCNPFNDGHKEDVVMFMWPSHPPEMTAQVEATYERFAEQFVKGWNLGPHRREGQVDEHP